MFLRFRQINCSLCVSIVETQRTNGIVRQHHRASLGTVSTAQPPDGFQWSPARPWEVIKARSAIWRTLHDAIARLNVDPATSKKLMTALQVRVPYPTEEQRGGAELAEAEHDAAFWEDMRGSTTKLIGCHENALAVHQREIAELKTSAVREAATAESAKAKAKRLDNYR
jgi:hypothetical protein